MNQITIDKAKTALGGLMGHPWEFWPDGIKACMEHIGTQTEDLRVHLWAHLFRYWTIIKNGGEPVAKVTGEGGISEDELITLANQIKSVIFGLYNEAEENVGTWEAEDLAKRVLKLMDPMEPMQRLAFMVQVIGTLAPWVRMDKQGVPSDEELEQMTEDLKPTMARTTARMCSVSCTKKTQNAVIFLEELAKIKELLRRAHMAGLFMKIIRSPEGSRYAGKSAGLENMPEDNPDLAEHIAAAEQAIRNRFEYKPTQGRAVADAILGAPEELRHLVVIHLMRWWGLLVDTEGEIIEDEFIKSREWANYVDELRPEVGALLLKISALQDLESDNEEAMAKEILAVLESAKDEEQRAVLAYMIFNLGEGKLFPYWPLPGSEEMDQEEFSERIERLTPVLNDLKAIAGSRNLRTKFEAGRLFIQVLDRIEDERDRLVAAGLFLNSSPYTSRTATTMIMSGPGGMMIIAGRGPSGMLGDGGMGEMLAQMMGGEDMEGILEEALRDLAEHKCSICDEVETCNLPQAALFRAKRDAAIHA